MAPFSFVTVCRNRREVSSQPQFPEILMEVTLWDRDDEPYISLEYKFALLACFKVIANIMDLNYDKVRNMCCISFIKPAVEIEISGSQEHLKTFFYDVVVQAGLIAEQNRRRTRMVMMTAQLSNSLYHHPYYKLTVMGDDAYCRLLRGAPINEYTRFLHVKNREDYDAAEMFDDQEEGLSLNDLSLTMIEDKVTSLKFLKMLNLKRNNIEDIPEALGSMECLHYLNLSYNNLGQSTKWKWLVSPYIRRNLMGLDLSHNALAYFPKDILQLENLKCLILNNNNLEELPPTIGNLRSIRYICVESNKLNYLPGSIHRLSKYLEILRVGSNPLYVRTSYNTCYIIPSLQEMAAKVIITEKIPCSQYNIPSPLTDYLQNSNVCLCDSPVLGNRNTSICFVRTDNIALIIDVPAIPVVIEFCSYKCYEEFKLRLNHIAFIGTVKAGS